MITLKYGNEFDEQDLVAFIEATGRKYIVQGQRNVRFKDHMKPQSLDVWLRNTFPTRRDTRLAENSVLDALVGTRKFEVVKEVCPDSGRPCKSIRLI